MPFHNPTSFATLEPQTHTISEKKISKSWQKRAPDGLHARITHLLRDVERAGLVQKKHRKPGRSAPKEDKVEDDTVNRQQGIEEVISMLSKRAKKLPLPPATQESDFDFESLLDTNRALESQLTANNHSVGLLKMEIEREKAALSEDHHELESLERALKSTESMRRKQAKNFHPVAKTMLSESTHTDTTEGNTVSVVKQPTNLHVLQADPEISLILEQLRSHLESMQNNVAPIQGIGDAIDRSEALLDLYAVMNLGRGRISHLHDRGLT